MVCTIAAGIVRTIIQTGPQTAQLLNNCRIFCLNKRIRFQTGSIVATIAVRLVATKVSSLSCFKDKRCNLRKLTLEKRNQNGNSACSTRLSKKMKDYETKGE
jgi:hypothetical protein